MQEESTDSMNNKKQIQEKESGGVNLGRHQAQCTICKSPYRQQIEEEWISWYSPSHFEKLFDLSRDALYRHAHALDLFTKRRKNILMTFEKIIERVDLTPMSGSVILSAIKAYAKINGAGQGGEPVQGTDLKKLSKRMSPEEREHFVKDGTVPDWFSQETGTTPCQGQEGEKASQVTEANKLQ
jgi:hypothetical protein